MAIQHRRGDYSKFNSGRMVDGEIAVILSGDPTDDDGKGVYMSFGPGKSKRMAFSEDVNKAKNDAIANAKQYADSAKTSATNASASEQAAKKYADSIKGSAEAAASSAAAAQVSQNSASASAKSALDSASAAKTSETNAKTSETNAKTSETNAASSASAAAESAKNAMSSTPDGYSSLASTFNALGLYVDSEGYMCQAISGETQD